MIATATGARRRSPARRREGMTLVEILVVVVIIALIAGGITYSVSAITRSNLRSASMRVISSSRYAYSRAASRGPWAPCSCSQIAGNGVPRSRKRSGSTWRTACGLRASSNRKCR